MKKTLIIILTLVVFIATGLLFTTESYFAPYPYVNTELSSGFSVNGNKIQKGMTKNEVYRLVGKPFSTFIDTSLSLKSGESLKNCEEYSKESRYSWFAWISVNVFYDNNDRVSGKNELINYN